MRNLVKIGALNEKLILSEDTGYDHYGAKEMYPFEGPAYIEYNGGARQVEVLTRARNGRWVWKNEGGCPDSEWYIFPSYEDALKVQRKVGGEILSWNEYMGIEDNDEEVDESLKEDVEEEDDLLELEEPIEDEPTFDGGNIEDNTDIVDDIEEPTEPVTQDMADNAYLTQLNDLITTEYGKIDEVKSIIATFTTEDAIESNSEIIAILNSFIDETTIGIGMLTKATELIDSTTNDLMQQGIEKAEDAIKNVDKEEEDKKEETEE